MHTATSGMKEEGIMQREFVITLDKDEQTEESLPFLRVLSYLPVLSPFYQVVGVKI